MTLKEVMDRKSFVIVGDTVNPLKYACKIKEAMLEAGYTVSCVGKELSSINDVGGKIDIIDLCINPAKGLRLMQECGKDFDCVVVQPGAGSEELFSYFREKSIPYIEDCLLIGLEKYCK